jgi:two-component system sensor histidine kinase UhpB
MKNILIYFLIFLSFSAHAQKEIRDSLQDIIRNSKPDTNKVNALYDLSFSYINSSPDSVLFYGTQSLDLAKKINYQKGIANGDYALGAGNYRKGDINKAQVYFEDCAAIAVKTGNKTLAIKANLGLGSINYAAGKLDTAISFYQKGVLLCEELNDLTRLGTLLNNIGNLHSAQQRMREALTVYRKSLGVSYKLKDTAGLALAYSNLANVYKLIEVYDSARLCVDSALYMAEKINDIYTKSLVMGTKGLIEFKSGNYETALPFLRQSIDVFKAKGNKAEVAALSISLGEVYLSKNKIDSALYYYSIGEKLAEEAGMNLYLQSADKGLSECYSTKGDYKNAYKYLQKFLATQNKFLDSLNIRKVTELNAKYESVSRQRRIDLLEKDKEIQSTIAAREKTVRYFLTGGALLLVLFLIMTYYRYRQRELLSEKLSASLTELRETQQQLIETERLREQENIRLRVSRDLHDDIGSTLSSINLLSLTARKRMEEKDEKKLAASLEKIGERTQTTLDNMNDIIWNIKPGNDSLADVLARMREYAGTVLEAKGIFYSIEFPDNHSEIALPLGLKNNMFLIFKEAVNNLAKYSACKEATISLTFENGKINMTIEDNGIGFETNKDSKGNGLNNIKRRAEESNAVLTIASNMDEGTRIEFNVNV